jgi:PadR family transcriptional regulator, regulatory protein PadR
MASEPPVPLPQGALDLLILRTIAREPQHGWAISQRIQLISKDLLRVQQGSLYPALHRLERRGVIRAEWGVSDNNRRAKYYALTRKGETTLEAQTRAWRTLTFAIGEVLGTT